MQFRWRLLDTLCCTSSTRFHCSCCWRCRGGMRHRGWKHCYKCQPRRARRWDATHSAPPCCRPRLAGSLRARPHALRPASGQWGPRALPGQVRAYHHAAAPRCDRLTDWAWPSPGRHLLAVSSGWRARELATCCHKWVLVNVFITGTCTVNGGLRLVWNTMIRVRNTCARYEMKAQHQTKKVFTRYEIFV